VSTGLLRLRDAEAARVRPEPPPPAEEPKDWIHVWLKEKKLEGYSNGFRDNALSERDDVLAAELDDQLLEKIGVDKIGDRKKIVRMLDTEKRKS